MEGLVGKSLGHPLAERVLTCSPWGSKLHRYEPPHDKTNKMTVRAAKTQISLGFLITKF